MNGISRRDFAIGLTAGAMVMGSGVSSAAAAGAAAGSGSRVIKLIYLAKRNPALDPDGFTRRWRMHGARGMAGTIGKYTLGYTQAETARPVAIPGASDAYDGVACFTIYEAGLRDPALSHRTDGIDMLADERETFDTNVSNFSLWVTEEVMKPGDLGGVTAFLFFADGSKARQTAASYRDGPGARRLILNIRDPESPWPSSLPYEAVVEIAADDVADFQAIVRAAPDALAGADVAVVTREAVLWDRMPGSNPEP